MLTRRDVQDSSIENNDNDGGKCAHRQRVHARPLRSCTLLTNFRYGEHTSLNAATMGSSAHANPSFSQSPTQTELNFAKHHDVGKDRVRLFHAPVLRSTLLILSAFVQIKTVSRITQKCHKALTATATHTTTLTAFYFTGNLHEFNLTRAGCFPPPPHRITST